MNETEARAVAALEPIAEALQADGYTLSVEDGDAAKLKVHIAATADACEECLAPKNVIQPMIEELLLTEGLGVDGVEVSYPDE